MTLSMIDDNRGIIGYESEGIKLFQISENRREIDVTSIKECKIYKFAKNLIFRGKIQ